MALTQEGILTFLLEHGGRVKNSVLLNYFNGYINCSDPAEKQHNRDIFKKFVNSVAVVKQNDDVKFVVVKKRYQDFVNGSSIRVTAHASLMDDCFGRQNTVSSFTSNRSGVHRDECDRMRHPDFENNISSNTDKPTSYIGDNGQQTSTKASRKKTNTHFSNRPKDTATVKVLNISNDIVCRKEELGPVFAIIAVNSPPRPPIELELRNEGGLHAMSQYYENSLLLAPAVPSQTEPTMNDHTMFDNDRWTTSTSYKHIRVQESHAPVSTQLTMTQSRNTGQGDDAKYTKSVTLGSMVHHEWLVICASGLWGQIYGFILKDIRLAMKKDFISGFTALHWAAKKGNCEMVCSIIDISTKKGACVNVNSKTHGGYTPLHIAAIHGHTEVTVLLVRGHGAEVNIRDNNGKKPFHYLREDASAELKELLGGTQPGRHRAEMEDEYREMHKGLNTITKIFQPHAGHRKNKGSS